MLPLLTFSTKLRFLKKRKLQRPTCCFSDLDIWITFWGRYKYFFVKGKNPNISKSSIKVNLLLRIFKRSWKLKELSILTTSINSWFCTITLLWKLNCDQSNWIATFVIWGNGSKWLPCKQMLNWMSVLWKNKKINLSTFSCRGGTEITEITNSSLQIKKGKNNPNPACRNIKNPPIFSLGSTYLQRFNNRIISSRFLLRYSWWRRRPNQVSQTEITRE